MNFKTFNKDRELAPKNYVDINLTPALSCPKDPFGGGFTFRGFLVKERIKSSGLKSNRDLLSRGWINRITLEELKGPSLSGVPNLQAQSTKTSISNPISLITGLQQKFEHSEKRFEEIYNDQGFIEKNILEKTKSQLPRTSRAGFRGYKFSVLNKNRNLVKSKYLRRLG